MISRVVLCVSLRGNVHGKHLVGSITLDVFSHCVVLNAVEARQQERVVRC